MPEKHYIPLHKLNNNSNRENYSLNNLLIQQHRVAV